MSTKQITEDKLKRKDHYRGQIRLPEDRKRKYAIIQKYLSDKHPGVATIANNMVAEFYMRTLDQCYDIVMATDQKNHLEFNMYTKEIMG